MPLTHVWDELISEQSYCYYSYGDFEHWNKEKS